MAAVVTDGARTLLESLREGKGPSIILLHGDEYRVRSTSRTVLEIVAPDSDRGLGTSRFDARTAPWAEIEAALLTPSLFAPTCTVVVESVPWFAPAERKTDLLEKSLGLWEEGQRDESGRAFMELLRSEGWTREQWLEAQDASELARTREDYRTRAREIQAVWQYCREQKLLPGNPKADEQGRILQLLERGLPDGCRLLLLAPQVDKRGRAYKQLSRNGCVVDLGVERDRSGRIRREFLAAFLDQGLRQARKRIDPRARETLLSRCGNELWTVQQEIEKLLLYVGDSDTVSPSDVDEVFTDQSESWVFDLTDSLGQRDALQALGFLRRLLANGEYPLRVLGAIASQVRRLLSARQLLDHELAGVWRPSMSFAQFQQRVPADTEGMPTKSPYANYLTLQRAEKFTLPKLRGFLRLIRETDARLKSSGVQPQAAMERLILEMCLP